MHPQKNEKHAAKIAKVLDRRGGACYNNFTSVKEGFFVVLLHARLFLRRKSPRFGEGGTAAMPQTGVCPKNKQEVPI